MSAVTTYHPSRNLNNTDIRLLRRSIPGRRLSFNDVLRNLADASKTTRTFPGLLIPQDTLIFKQINREYSNTKRGILSLVSAVFDPLGILTPSWLGPKLIIQELWKLKIDWDSKIPLEIETRRIKWKRGLDKISQVSLNRCHGFQYIDKMEVELNIFCDAICFCFCFFSKPY